MKSINGPIPELGNCICQFVSSEGVKAGAPVDIPLEFTEAHLQELLNELLSNDDPLPYSFFVKQEEIRGDLRSFMDKRQINQEVTLEIVYEPQAVFRVRPLTRCTSTLPGHTDSVLTLAFSPDGSMLASGSGDKTVRLWDLLTQTPLATGVGHTHWVLCVAWSPDAKLVASGSHDSTIRIWEPATQRDGMDAKVVLRGHKNYVTGLAWQPQHRTAGNGCRKLVSCSKDGTAKIWDAKTGSCLTSLSMHTSCVTCVKWGGEGLIYTASQDRTIIVWAISELSDDGHGVGNFSAKVIRQLKNHGHWVNSLALSNEHLLRTGGFDHTVKAEGFSSEKESYEASVKRYGEMKKKELLVSGSDDFTMYLWSATDSNKPLARMTGHQQLINSVAFSPDGLYIASGSFDKSVKIWGRDGTFVATLRGHVGSVYSVVWSADSRMVLSGSKDSTVKLWSMKTKRLSEDLPGHADEVFCIDWDPSGGSAASGGKDRVLRIWRGAN